MQCSKAWLLTTLDLQDLEMMHEVIKQEIKDLKDFNKSLNYMYCFIMSFVLFKLATKHTDCFINCIL